MSNVTSELLAEFGLPPEPGLGGPKLGYPMTNEQFVEWNKRAAAMEELNRQKDEVMRDLFKGDPEFAKVAGYRTVHVEGGPCIDSAPEGERFVSPDHAMLVTCEICRVAAALAEGTPILDKPNPFAEAYVKLLPARQNANWGNQNQKNWLNAKTWETGRHTGRVGATGPRGPHGTADFSATPVIVDE
jgi:hypothetical protein